MILWLARWTSLAPKQVCMHLIFRSQFRYAFKVFRYKTFFGFSKLFYGWLGGLVWSRNKCLWLSYSDDSSGMHLRYLGINHFWIFKMIFWLAGWTSSVPTQMYMHLIFRCQFS